MTSEEALETAECIKESLETGNIIEPQKQSVTLECKPYVDNTLTFKPIDPKDMKVVVWGKELTSEAEWEDFLKIGEELEQENKQLKEQLNIYKKALSVACETILKLQGHFPAEYDFIEKRFELEDSFLEKDE